MNTADRKRLTQVLSAHVGRVAADLRAQMLAEGPVQDRARRVHADEKVGDDYAVWTDLLARRAAVMWALKSVYARVLEDRGLLSPGRLLDPEAQHLFEKVAPNLGETAFLRWVWRDLATSPGGLPELFAPQPAEVAVPSDALSRELLEIWRKKDPDTDARWSFANEKFDGELMGDLYQELDPVVKDRFALCQTPDFVRAFILDRTLTPAIEEYGADTVRLIDPACGSGHFLIDGLRRLVAATAEQHPDWKRRAVVGHALKRVVGTDLNDYACALARARLIMTAADLAGVDSLREAAAFHPHVYWADGLEQVERDEATKPQQTGLFTQAEEPPPRATLTRPEVREALRDVLRAGFHAVVANPPYITEKDENRKAYHRENVGRKQRYVSAYRQYSLGSPFTERCFQLAVREGYVGIITSNNFMKREFGKPLIEEVLAGLDLTLVVDTSQAYIPFHATPTVLLFGRNRATDREGTKASPTVRAVMGKRGETGTPPDPSQGKVWLSIVQGWETVGWEDEYVSVTDVPRETLGKHPWSLGGGGAAELKERLERERDMLSSFAQEIGTGAVTREDGVYLIGRRPAYRLGIPTDQIRPLVEGDTVRDWSIVDPDDAIWPYEPHSLGAVTGIGRTRVERALWPWRTRLRGRVAYGKSQLEHGLTWFEYSMFFADRFRTPLSIAFAFVATHNHFVLDRGGKVFKQSTPLIKLPAASTDDDHYALLGVLNSSTACFWMKQVFHPKGSATSDISSAGLLPENNRYEFASTGMERFPIPGGLTTSPVAALARMIDRAAQGRAESQPGEVLKDKTSLRSASSLVAALAAGENRERSAFQRMVYLQEELDWQVYRLYDIAPSELVGRVTEVGIRPEDRPYCWEGGAPPEGHRFGADLLNLYRRRRAAIEAGGELALVENPVQKRLWRGTQGVFGRYDRTYADKVRTALTAWLAERVEAAAQDRTQPFTSAHLVAALQDDSEVAAVAEVLAGRRDFSLADLIDEAVRVDAVPNHVMHIFKETGLDKRKVWEKTWDDQRREDAGESVIPEVPPPYAPADFLKPEVFRLRGKLDVPKERFIAFTEVPGDGPTLYGWAGWTPLQRLKALLALDEKLEDAGHPIGDRIGVLDSAWRLLPDVAREDAAAAARLKAELASLVGKDGPSPEMLAAWKAKFPPPGSGRGRRKAG